MPTALLSEKWRKEISLFSDVLIHPDFNIKSQNKLVTAAVNPSAYCFSNKGLAGKDFWLNWRCQLYHPKGFLSKRSRRCYCLLMCPALRKHSFFLFLRGGRRERLLIGTSPVSCLHSRYLVIGKVRLLPKKSGRRAQQLDSSGCALNLCFSQRHKLQHSQGTNQLEFYWSKEAVGVSASQAEQP